MVRFTTPSLFRYRNVWSKESRVGRRGTQLPAETPQVLLLRRGERSQQARDDLRVTGKDLFDPLPALARQRDPHETLVFLRPLPDDQAFLLEPFHDRRRARAAPQQLAREVALAERPQ